MSPKNSLATGIRSTRSQAIRSSGAQYSALKSNALACSPQTVIELLGSTETSRDTGVNVPANESE